MCLSKCLLQSSYGKLDYATVANYDPSLFLLRNNCVSQNAILQCLVEPRSCQCQTCDSNANLDDFCSTNSNFDSSSFSTSNSFFDRNRKIPLPPNYYGDSSSCFRFFQNFNNYPKNYSDPDYWDITKDSSTSYYNGYETKQSNVCMNTFYGDVATFDGDVETIDADMAALNINEDVFVNELYDEKATFDGDVATISDDMAALNLNEDGFVNELYDEKATFYGDVATIDADMAALNLNEDLFVSELYDVVAKYVAERQTKVKHKYGYEDYDYKNQTNSSKPKDEKNDLGIFYNTCVEQSQLIWTHDEMLQWKDQRLASRPVSNSRARQEALKRYRAKKKIRKFGKQIRYESRKSTADTKKRFKGRFTKAGGEYDYDPKASTISKVT